MDIKRKELRAKESELTKDLRYFNSQTIMCLSCDYLI